MNIDMKKTGKYMLSIYSLFVIVSGNSTQKTDNVLQK